MTEHTSELGLVVEKRKDAARDVDESARQRKRIDRRLIDNSELPRQIRTLGKFGELKTDATHVLLECLIVVNAHLGFDLGVGLATHRNLLGLAHQRELTLSRR